MTKCAGSQADGVWAMPSARALLVASLLTEPPYGCLGPSGNDRYRKRADAVGASRVGCQVATALSGFGDWEITTAGRQDKSRKVRPVGRLGNVSNLNHAPNIAKDRRNLRVSPWRCSCSVFDTLRRAR